MDALNSPTARAPPRYPQSNTTNCTWPYRRQLTNYLYNAHMQGKHSTADLYNLIYLFLRHYLSGQTWDNPLGNDEGLVITLQDSITVLNSIDLGMYQLTILPSILEHYNCKDVIVQEYLMEVVIQSLPDEFHLYSLGLFLSTTAQLQQSVNIEQIVIALIDRFAAYAVHEVENESLEETKHQEEVAASTGLSSATLVSGNTVWGSMSLTSADAGKSFVGLSLSNGEATLNGKKSPMEEEENIKLFEVFWHQVGKRIKARPDLSIQDITALLVSLMDLS
ncbi:hypothetical protein M0805_001611, partial [Coniferiporia weirii]